MTQYIDKAAVVAEIERRIKGLKDCHADTIACYAGEISGLKRLLSFLNTLEVKKSEDERIRKSLIKSYTNQHPANFPTVDGFTREQILAWLEKQGEQKSADKKYTFNAIPRLLSMIQPTDRAKAYCQKLIDILIQEGYDADAKIVGNCLKQMNGEKVAMATMDGQQPTRPVWKYKKDHTPLLRDSFILNKYGCVGKSPSGALVSDVWVLDFDELAKLPKEEFERQSEQKHTWSEEDEKFFKTALWHISNSVTNGKRTDEHCQTTDWLKGVKERLKSLKDRVQPQPKQEWSEEEKARIDKIIDVIDWAEDKGYIRYSDWEDYVCYVKSLRPQNVWKPSDEQMDALNLAIGEASSVDTAAGDEAAGILTSLYEQLDKLK